MIEMAIVAVALFCTAALVMQSPIELIGALAVIATFGHIQVADRLHDYATTPGGAPVECHRWLTRYLLAKETLWILYFVLHASWSAILGAVLFLVYPLWRSWYRRTTRAVIVRQRVRCECPDHEISCRRQACFELTRDGVRLSVCDTCDITGDTDKRWIA